MMAESGNLTGLEWVRDEVEQSLHLARDAMERFARGSEDGEPMQECRERLREVHGSLQIIELPDAVDLAAEMLALADWLAVRGSHEEAEAVELLMEASLRLSGHLDRLQRGYRDAPEAHRALIDRMRKARRGEGALGGRSEAETGAAGDLEASLAAFMVDQGPQRVRRLRQQLHRGLLAGIRGEVKPVALWRGFEWLFARLEALTPPSPLARVWVLAGAVAERAAASGEGVARERMMLFRRLDEPLLRPKP